jgi:hypothetical protein
MTWSTTEMPGMRPALMSLLLVEMSSRDGDGSRIRSVDPVCRGGRLMAQARVAGGKSSGWKVPTLTHRPVPNANDAGLEVRGKKPLSPRGRSGQCKVPVGASEVGAIL